MKKKASTKIISDKAKKKEIEKKIRRALNSPKKSAKKKKVIKKAKPTTQKKKSTAKKVSKKGKPKEEVKPETRKGTRKKVQKEVTAKTGTKTEKSPKKPTVTKAKKPPLRSAEKVETKKISKKPTAKTTANPQAKAIKKVRAKTKTKEKPKKTTKKVAEKVARKVPAKKAKAVTSRKLAGKKLKEVKPKVEVKPGAEKKTKAAKKVIATIEKKVLRKKSLPEQAKERVTSKEAGIEIKEAGRTGVPVKEEFPLKAFETLPTEYGENIIRLMVVDPFKLFTFWEVREDDLKILGGNLSIRVYDVTGIDLEKTDAKSYFDIPLSQRIGSQYIQVHSGKDFIADIGMMYGVSFRTISRSNKVSTPKFLTSQEDVPLPEIYPLDFRLGY